MGIRTPRWWSLILSACILLTTCTSHPTPPITSPVLPNPSVTLLTVPEVVCGSATQVRLQVQASHNLPVEHTGIWSLHNREDKAIASGDWVVRDGAVLIPFPNNGPLPADDYTVRLFWREVELAAHSFAVGPATPTIQKLSISTLPDSDGVSILWIDAPIRLFYINYAFTGGCPGAPYWISTQDAGGETVCRQHDALMSIDGEGTAACYREDETFFPTGPYTTELILMGEVSEAISFEIAEIAPISTPRPTPTPRPPTVRCDELFTAAGVTPEGDFFLPIVFFDWYTQGIYAGRMCRNLQPGTPWHSRWVRGGTVIREEQGTWTGPAEGTIWDVLGGTDTNPFVPPGTYTVTLKIANTTSEATFSVYGYRTPEGGD